MTWHTSSNEDDFQGLVIDLDTGKNIAVTYDPKHAVLVAAAPDLLKALIELVEDVEYAQPQIKPGLIGNRQIRKAREAISKVVEGV